ncbi:MAG: BlaB/IND/MUS family subclass B1 metallo-beta-lactamase [Bacteroidetes bacterium]|nr:MAG: BlaB/IND/MUS family subclass B1 metallo-beta-lactamase [Bacteroidota bacterium]REK05676.1 MAG: BlaB/IND/MUS family subclass B1 metallo-beta-lactamase [Bacteroidota bacterium]REK32018.1 MAG: BlaB/IND/MUS family subclass B1 metallo-beta-lactamase [Bacteroidota bacterium]REK50082.1 MAG: BlaB/IND/MUS family subclass B1 metallo-beta-lactamase [Bacteroidota bacterium]
MRYFVLIIILLLSYNYIWGQSPQKLRISQLKDNFYVYTTYKDLGGYMFPSNSMYLVTKEGVVMFDTPWDTSQCQPLFDSISARHQSKVVMAIVTHYHDDRTAGLEFLRNAGVMTYSSKLTYELCTEFNEARAEYIFTKDTSFSIGEYGFETFYPGEGHTRDNLVIWFGKQKILYGGCLVKSTENKSIGNIKDANMSEWDVSIRNIIKKYPKTKYVIPGHFDWKSNQSLNHTLNLLKQHKN